ncbi:MAG: DUF1622 domain-containing protein [Cyanobacteriota bacterium]|nr:DUF1622 domain-containing protein [Cyanobacteriota bacterium]
MSRPTLVIEHGLQQFGAAVRLLLELLSVLTVLLGLAATLRSLLLASTPRLGVDRRFNRARLSFAAWLSMALEFQLAADIVATTASASGSNLIQLAVVAVIRTFLNVFLAREAEAERCLERTHDPLAAA